jgi:thymidylate synthase
MHNILRSNDLMLGCPHDVAGFALLQRMLAARLGVRPGKYTHSISNAHIYDLHWAQARELLERDHEHPEITLDLPAETLARAEASDYALVGEIEAQLSAQYHPMPNLKGLTLVV